MSELPSPGSTDETWLGEMRRAGFFVSEFEWLLPPNPTRVTVNITPCVTNSGKDHR